MKKITIPRIYVFSLVAIFMLFPVLMIMVSNSDYVQVQAVDLNCSGENVILNAEQLEIKDALMQCIQSDAMFSVNTPTGDKVYKDEFGYVFFEVEPEKAWANSSKPMTISGKEAAQKVFDELLAYEIVEDKGYVAQIYPVIESTYNGEKDVFENDTVVYYEITIEKQDSEGKPIKQIRSIYNNNVLISFGLYGE